MRKLVWKFWLAIWAAVIGTLAVSLLIVSQWQRFDSHSKVQQRPHAMLQRLAEEIEVSLDTQQDVQELLLHNEMSEFGTVYLITPDGTDLLQRPIPSAILNGDPAVSQPEIISTPVPVFARAIKLEDRPTHFMIYQFSSEANPMWLLFRQFGLSWVLLISSLVAGLISMWLAFIVVRPLNKLAAATARQHDDNHQIDLEDKMLERKDEIGDLARQLNASANQTRITLQRQQEFIRDVSHEVRTPLARLQLASENILIDPNDAHSLRQIETEVSTIDQLVHDLLQLSKSDAAVALHQHGGIDIREVLAECRKNLATWCAGKNVTVAEKYGVGTMNVCGDHRLLIRAFENILSNAVRHAPPDSTIEVEVSTTPKAIQVTIRDRGPGVPQEDLHTIFHPFVRLDESRRRDTGGAGVGLALVKKIIELHGGQACAHNHHQDGLVVRVQLPREEQSCVA